MGSSVTLVYFLEYVPQQGGAATKSKPFMSSLLLKP
jgi:hypothetical protein